MSAGLRDPARRLAGLRLRADLQRQQLAAHVHAIEVVLSPLDKGLGNVRQLLHRPLIMAAGAGLLYFVGARRLSGFAGRALLLISTVRRVLGFLK